MFRRSQKSAAEESRARLDEESAAGSAASTPGKGRPTPSRKEAQAAARERARAPMDKKAAQKVLRERRLEQNRKIRQGMKTGDERYLAARDQGPVKRAVRDFIDSRLCFAELLLPLLLVIMVLTYVGSASLRSFANGLWTATILLTIVDTMWMLRGLRKSLRASFPGEDLKGTSSYAILRVLQMRFMRQPKAKVGLGGKPKG